MFHFQWTNTDTTTQNRCNKRAKRQQQRQQSAALRSAAEAAGRFSPGFLHSLENPPDITAIVRTTLLSQSRDQNSSHVSKEQMSYQLGWCEHRYNADRKPRQSLVEPIMGRAVGAALQTPLSLCRATLRYMINFLDQKHPGSRESAPLCRWRSWWVVAQPEPEPEPTPDNRAKHEKKKSDWKGSFSCCFFLLPASLPHSLAFNGSSLGYV